MSAAASAGPDHVARQMLAAESLRGSRRVERRRRRWVALRPTAPTVHREQTARVSVAVSAPAAARVSRRCDRGARRSRVASGARAGSRDARRTAENRSGLLCWSRLGRGWLRLEPLSVRLALDHEVVRVGRESIDRRLGANRICERSEPFVRTAIGRDDD